MDELTLEEANRRLAEEGYPPIQKLPADPAALVSWKRIVDARRELEQDGRVSDTTWLAIGAFCHCLKCPTYPRGERPAIYCLTGKTEHAPKATHCKCPTCGVYEVGGFEGKFFCLRGQAVEGGEVVHVARAFLQMEADKGNPGKRIPERLMAPPQWVGKTQDDVAVPEKVPGWTTG